jgi:hypothetical protein
LSAASVLDGCSPIMTSWGMTLDPPRIRNGRLSEGVHIMKDMWETGVSSRSVRAIA